MSATRRTTLAAALPAIAVACVACLAPQGCGGRSKTVRVFGADSLSASFQEMKHEFEKLHPDTRVELDIHGSVMLTRLVPVRRGDVVAVADHRLVEKVLAPNYAKWVAKFISTEIVIAAHAGSKYRDEMTPENWHEILLRPDVKYGAADATQDSCGYYTSLAWKLAAKHYDRPGLAQELIDKCPKEHIPRDALALISEHLGQQRIDYAFVYRVHARDLKLPFTPLPKEINLGDPSFARDYQTAEILVPDFHGGQETMTGTYIAFGITVRPDALNPQGARDFVKFVLSERGREILGRSEFVTIHPARVPTWGKFPAFLEGLAVPENASDHDETPPKKPSTGP